MEEASNEEVFEDATEQHEADDADDSGSCGGGEDEDSLDEIGQPCGENMQFDLLQSIIDTHRALDMFLNNEFERARTMVQPLASKSIYHALGYCTISYLQASMTMERPDLQLAMEVTKQGLQVCQRFRRKPGPFRSNSARDFTDEQCHAELCFAELQLEKAVLTFMQDESLISFVRSGLKIRDCHRAYRLCWRLLHKRQWRCQQLRLHFESGARLGEGAFNLLLSLLPPRLLKLLEFVGFSGSRQTGLQELQLAAELNGSIRAPLVRIMLLAYHTTFTHVLGSGTSDLDCVRSLLQHHQATYPQGALTLYFHGRLLLLDGQARDAVRVFEQSVDSQSEWTQLHLLCYWELMWAHAFAADWLLAMKYAETLAAESRWSKATLLYLKASFLYHCSDGTAEAGSHLENLFQQVPQLQHRSSVRAMPVERFAVQRAQQFAQQNARLTLPALELVYVWNGLPLAAKNEQVISLYLTEIQSASDEIDQRRQELSHPDDDLGLVLLLKGACLKHRGRSFQAEQCFRQITSHLANSIRRDGHVIAWAWLELALMQMEAGDLREARNSVEQCRNQRCGHLDSRIQFRSHALLLQLQELSDAAHCHKE